jgi:hypothetical protein
MRRLACYFWASMLALAGAAFAQDQSGGYYSAACLKLQPGKAAEFRQFSSEQTRKVMQAGADTGDFTAWYLVRSVFPTGAEARCDYFSVVTYKAAPLAPLGGQRLDAAVKKSGISMTAAEYFTTRSSLANLISSELWQTAIQVGTLEKGDFMYANAMKVHNMSEWMDMEQRIWKPMAESWIKEGGMRAWMVNRPVLPGGTDLKYQAVTLDVFPSWEHVFKNRPVNDTFKKIHVNKDLQTTFDKISKTRDLGRRDLLYVEDKVAASTGAVVSQK